MLLFSCFVGCCFVVLHIVLGGFLSFGSRIRFSVFPGVGEAALSGRVAVLGRGLPMLGVTTVCKTGNTKGSGLLGNVGFLGTVTLGGDFLSGSAFNGCVFTLGRGAKARPVRLAVRFRAGAKVPCVCSIRVVGAKVISRVLRVSNLNSRRGRGIFAHGRNGVRCTIAPSRRMNGVILK